MRAWLAVYDWRFVTAQNAVLCARKSATHGPTSDGHEKTKKFWEQNYQREMSLADAVEVCRRCHRMAPFCFYNGNTFAAVIRDAVLALRLEPDQSFVVRSLAGHIVAGVSTGEEDAAFAEFSDSLDH